MVAEGGNKYFQHDATLKLFSTSPADDDVIKDLMTATSVLIMETNNEEFLILGANNGMDLTEYVQNSGQTDNSDTTDSLTFVGGEKNKPLRFFITDYATTSSTLEGYEI